MYRDCLSPGSCWWGSPRQICARAKTPGGSDSWFSLPYQKYACLKLASFSKVFPVHPSQRSQRSNNHPWTRQPGRRHHWTCVPKEGQVSTPAKPGVPSTLISARNAVQPEHQPGLRQRSGASCAHSGFVKAPASFSFLSQCQLHFLSCHNMHCYQFSSQ